jgi:hypothetical protein
MKIKAFLSLMKHHAMKSRYFHEKSDAGKAQYFTGNEEESFRDLITLILTAKEQVCFIDLQCHRLEELSLAVSPVQRTDTRGKENCQPGSLSI